MKNIKVEVTIKVTEERGICDTNTLGACTLTTQSELKPDEIRTHLSSQIEEAKRRAYERLEDAINAEKKRLEMDEELRLERKAANY